MDYRVLLSLSKSIIPFSLLLLLYIFPVASTAATTTSKAFNLSTITFKQGYSPLFSDFNIEKSPDDRSFRLLLNRFSGKLIHFFLLLCFNYVLFICEYLFYVLQGQV